MTPPTLHEFAGIFMLALATVLVSHPSAGSPPASATLDHQIFTYFDGFRIDGIENAAFPAR